MLAVTTDPVPRSSLEEMLESLQRKDELLEHPESCKPPSLPSRPKSNSRARPPSSTKRRVHEESEIAQQPQRLLSSECNNGWEEKSIFRFQAKEVEAGESPAPKSNSASDMGEDSGLENGSCELLNDEERSALRGTHHAHCNFHDLKEVVTTLQSYVRGEIARKEFRKNLQKPHYGNLDQQQLVAAVLLIQSVLRGWLVRRQQHFACLHSPVTLPFKDVPSPQPGVVEELQNRLLMAEAALGEKDKEITVLREQVDQLKSKMKAMELQMSLDTAKKNAVDPGNKPPRKHKNGIRSPCSYNSEEASMGSLSPGCGSPIRFMDILYGENNAAISASNSIVPLVNEFEQQKQLFDLEAQAIVDAKRQHHSPSATKPLEEVQKLKHKFDAWKKDFGIQLRETKAKASRMGPREGEKQGWKWWGLKRRRS